MIPIKKDGTTYRVLVVVAKGMAKGVNGILNASGVQIVRSSSLSLLLDKGNIEQGNIEQVSGMNYKLLKLELTKARIEHRFARAKMIEAKKQAAKASKAAPTNMMPVGKAVWSDSWRAYYYRNQEAIPGLLKHLKSNLDDQSAKTLDITVDRFIYAIPSTQAPYDLFIEKEKYLTDFEVNLEKQGMNEQFAAEKDKIVEKYPELKDAYLPLHSVLYHAGLACFPDDVKEAVKGRDMIDGGACWGDSALFLRQYEPSRIFSFEPDTTNFNLLQECKIFTKFDNLVPVKAGLSDSPGRAEFFSQDRECNIGASMVQTSTTVSEDSIDIESIDHFCNERGDTNIGFIKLDIEGRELETLQGAVEILKKDRPALAVAIYHRPEDFFEIKPFLEGLGLDYRFIVRRFPVGVAYGLYLLAY